MTISSFCHEQLRQQGPLTIDVLARLAVEAGVTRSRTPEASVRDAISHTAAALPDGRWASPIALLEGRWLTTRQLSRSWYGDEIDHAPHDLLPLELALRANDIPLATGGTLRRQGYRDSWRAPKQWPGLERSEHQLYALGIRGGALQVELVDETPGVRARGHALALAVGRLDLTQPQWSPVSSSLLTRIWELVAAGSPILTEPTPPLSECIPPLVAALRADADLRAERARHWTPTLDLPTELQDVAVAAARDADLLLDEWLDDFVMRALRAVDTGTMWQPLYDHRVRPLRRRI